MKRPIISAIKRFDQAFSKVFLKFFHEKNSLITFLFHGLFRNQEEINSDVVDPQERVTVELFRQFVEYYLSCDYIFIAPDDILSGLNSHKRYILITFDDGYFNNTYALPILTEYRIPAVFCITTNPVKYNKCFWWDVLYRERVKSGATATAIAGEQRQLKSTLGTSERIERYLMDLYGENSFQPISDSDRPFSASELRDFSREKYVFIGNHTCDHAILTSYSAEGIRTQIRSAQEAICDMTGISPQFISYPNGNYSGEVIRISKEIGLKLGITVVPRKNYLPLDLQRSDGMRLGRFILDGRGDFARQCETCRSDITLLGALRKLSRRDY